MTTGLVADAWATDANIGLRMVVAASKAHQTSRRKEAFFLLIVVGWVNSLYLYRCQNQDRMSRAWKGY
jgi:hypothetical protein